MSESIQDKDLYAILELQIDATESEIKKAYRKKALQCHPDKNPDNPNAAALFHELSLILEILTDQAARNAYDRVYRAKQQAQIRYEQLDQRRKKFKEDLDARERQGFMSGDVLTDAERLKIQIERLRKEGSQALNEEREYVQRQVQLEKEQQQSHSQWDSAKHRIKIKWRAEKGDPNNGGYNYTNLTRFLSKYGDIVGLVISRKKLGSGVVEFATREAAEMAVSFEKGLTENPTRLEWLTEAPGVPAAAPTSTLVSDNDFESLVLRQMRQAEERKRLIEQMMATDD